MLAMKRHETSFNRKNVYDKEVVKPARISGDVFRLDVRGKVRATSRGKMTAQKIFLNGRSGNYFLLRQ